MEKEISMNKMGVVPIKKLMLLMGIPMIMSMVLQAFYNIVDSYFVSCIKDTVEISNMGNYAVNALTLAYPIQMLMVAIGVGTGVGVNALLSKSLGQENREKASRIAGNAVFLGVCIYVVFLLFGLFVVNGYLNSQTSDAIVLEMGSSYLGICTRLSFGVILFMIYEKLLQSTGRTTLSTIAQMAGVLTNIIFDPILIFGYFGFPQMGINGAAYATVTGQVVSLIVGAIFNYRLNKDIDSKLIYLKPQGAVISEIYQVGLPAILMQALMSFMTYGVNIIFGTISSAVVIAYGVYYKIQQFIFFAAFGLNNALIPIVAFNYGKKDRVRVNDGIKYGIIYILIIMGLGALGFQMFASQIAGIFALSAETQRLCIRAIRIVTLGYLFAGANIAFQGIFQAFGSGVCSLIISFLRLIAIVLPLAYLLTKLQNAQDIIWIAFPAAEACALILAIIFMKQISKAKISEYYSLSEYSPATD
ncbi:MAG: MATE family efflux transporter [Firmicutes bacterium]|nr:MATE family efflux transporter [Bacillota bacterium]